MDVYVMNTLECLWMVCHMGTFQLLEGCDKGSKPSLLILAEEVLSRGLQELVSLKMITPYHGSRSCPALSHLLFANDVIILYNGHKRNLKKLKIFLETKKCNGQKVNFDKSQCFLSNRAPRRNSRSLKRNQKW